MSTPPVSAVASAPTDIRTDIPASEKRQRWFEVSLVLLIAFGSSFLYSLYLLRKGPGAATPSSDVPYSVGMVQEATTLLLLGYVLSRRGLKFASLGLRWSSRDLGVGLVVACLSYAAYALGYTLIRGVQYSMFGSAATGPTANDFFAHPSIVAIPFAVLNPFFEELIVRAYLMTEITELTGSSVLAVVISVAVQFSYHLYYGWSGALSLSCMFLTFALYYARSRRALPIVVAHGFFDIYGLLRLFAR